MSQNPEPSQRSLIVGAVLTQIREQASKSQREVAKALGVTQSAVSRLEIGRAGMSVEQLLTLARFLAVDATAIVAMVVEAEKRCVGVEGAARVRGLVFGLVAGQTP